jgi:hypothetical protein
LGYGSIKKDTRRTIGNLNDQSLDLSFTDSEQILSPSINLLAVLIAPNQAFANRICATRSDSISCWAKLGPQGINCQLTPSRLSV